MKRSFTKFYAMMMTVIMLLTCMPITPALAMNELALPSGIKIIEEEAFYQDTSLEKVVLPDGLEEIHAKAFAGSTVTEVYLPESLVYIADDAFDNCADITITAVEGSYAYEWAVTMGYIEPVYKEKQTENGFLYIAYSTYAEITGYLGAGGAIAIPSVLEDLPVTGIGYGAFSGNEQITAVTIPSGVTYIGGYAFDNCTALSMITLPESLEYIGDGSFANTSLTEIILPDGLTTVDYKAFSGCMMLETVSIPASLINLDAYTFMNCRIKSFIVAAGNTKFSVINGVLFNVDGSELIRYPSGRADSTYTMPSTVMGVGEGAFDSASSLTKVILPEGVTSIGYYAFYNCTNLVEIELPESLDSISSYAFYECESLNKIRIPASVRTINNGAFDGCPNLTIYGFAGMAAETYAEAYGLPFIDINKESQLNAPQELEATVLSESSLRLTWNAVEGATAYQLYYLIPGGETMLLDTVSNGGEAIAPQIVSNGFKLMRSRSADGLEWTATELTAGQTYEFSAASVMGDGSTSLSDTIQVTMPRLAAPQNVRAEEQLVADVVHYSDNSRDLMISWDAVDGATQYEVYRLITSRYGSGNFDMADLVGTVEGNSFMYERLPLSSVWAYSFYIIAVQETGEQVVRSEPSEEFPVTHILTKPVNVQAQADGTDKAIITWDAVEYATEYRIYRTNSTGDWQDYIKYYQLGTTTDTNYTDTGLNISDQVYVYKVMAFQQDGNLLCNSVYSEIAWVGDDLDKPQNLRLEQVSDTVYMLSFDAVEGASYYDLQSHIMDGYYHGTVYEGGPGCIFAGNNEGTITLRIDLDATRGTVFNDIQVVAHKSILSYFPVQSYSDETVSINAEYLKPTEVRVSDKKVSVGAGQTVQLTATVLPETAQYKGLSWSSSDSSVATVDQNGLVTGVSAGNAIITASSSIYDGIEDTVEVIVISGDEPTTLTSGLYTIHSGLSDAYVLDVDGGINAIGQNVQLLTGANIAGQVFQVEQSEDGWYTLRTVLGEKAVHVVGSGEGANVQIGAVTGSNSEKWKFYETASGGYQIINHNGYALEADGSMAQDGMNVHVNTIADGAGQRWTLTAAELCAPAVPINCAVSESGIVTWTEVLGAESYTVKAYRTTKENVSSGITIDDVVFDDTTIVTITAINSAGSESATANYTCTDIVLPETGWYYIAPAADQTMVISVEMGSNASVTGEAMLQRRMDGTQSHQLIKLTKRTSAGSIYFFNTVHEEMRFAQSQNGQIDVNTSGGRDVYWKFREAGDGTYYILNYSYGYLDTGADDASELNPSKVSSMIGNYFSPLDGSISQKWVLIPAVFTETPVPKGVRVDSITEESTTIHWLEDYGTTSYTVTIRQGDTVVQELENITWNANSRERSQVIMGLAMGTEYTATVTAVNENGTNESEPVSFTTKLHEPNAPDNLAVSDITAQGATISWDAAEGATSYNIEINSGSTTVVNETGVTSPYVCTDLPVNTEYTVTVTAVNAAGTASAGVTFRTALREVLLDNDGLYTFTNADVSQLKMYCYVYGLDASIIEAANQAKFNVIRQPNGWYVIEPLFSGRRVASAAVTNLTVKIPNESETTDELSLWKFYEAEDGTVYIANQKQLFLSLGEEYTEGEGNHHPIMGMPYQGNIAQRWRIDSTSLSKPEKPTFNQNELVVGSTTVKIAWWPRPGVDHYTLVVHSDSASESDITVENAVSPCEVAGLKPNMSYTISLTATNAMGNSIANTYAFTTKMDEVPMKDGWYVIQSTQMGGVLEVSMQTGYPRNATVNTANGGNRQIFKIIKQPNADGWYKIYTALNEKVLKVSGGYAGFTTDDSSDATLWKFYDAAEGNTGNVWIQNKANKILLSFVIGHASVSTEQSSSSESPSTKWRLIPTNLAIPYAPSASVSDKVYNGVTISWGAEIGTASYNVLIKQGNTVVASQTGATSPYICTTLLPNKNYTAIVTSVNSAGQKDKEISFKTPLKEVSFATGSNTYYVIQSAANTNLLLDIENGLTSDGTVLNLHGANQSEAQCFQLIEDTDGWYQIRNLCGKNVEVKDASTQNGALVQIYSVSSQDRQRWKFYDAGNGTVYIRSKLESEAVMAWNGSAASGASVTAVKLTEASNQKWVLVSTSKAVDPTKVEIGGDKNKEVVKGKSISLTATVSPSNCTNPSVTWSSSDNKVATVSSTGVVTGLQVGKVTITCTTNIGPQGSNHPKATCTLEVIPGIEYKPKDNGANLYIIESACGQKVLDVIGAYNRAGQNIHIWEWHDGNNQKFYIKEQSDGWYKFQTILKEKTIDANAASDNKNVYIADDNNSNSTRWKFYDAGNGFYYIKNQTGYYLDVKDGIPNNGINVQLCGFNGGNAQKWKLTQTSIAIPHKPVDVNVYDVTETSAKVSWASVLGTRVYNVIVLRGTDEVGRYDNITSPFTIPNLVKGTKYMVFVHAQNEIDSSYETYEFTTQGSSSGGGGSLPSGVVRRVTKSDLSWVLDQWDYPSMRYSGSNVKDSGCGLCSTVNAVGYLTGYLLDLQVVRDFSEQGCHVTSGGATYWSLYDSISNSVYGERCGFKRVPVNDDLESYKRYLKNGGVIIIGVQRVRNADKGGHIMALVDYNESTNKFLILDSAGTQQNHIGQYWQYTGNLAGWYTIDSSRKIYCGSMVLQMYNTAGIMKR